MTKARKIIIANSEGFATNERAALAINRYTVTPKLQRHVDLKYLVPPRSLDPLIDRIHDRATLRIIKVHKLYLNFFDGHGEFIRILDQEHDRQSAAGVDAKRGIKHDLWLTNPVAAEGEKAKYVMQFGVENGKACQPAQQLLKDRKTGKILSHIDWAQRVSRSLWVLKTLKAFLSHHPEERNHERPVRSSISKA